MKPAIRFEANDEDITKQINARLISASFTDNEGFKSDSLTILLDDRDNAVALPSTVAEIKVWMGYVETGLEYLGLFISNDYHLSGPPDVFEIKATAAHLGNSETINGIRSTLKEKKNRSWHEKTVAEIVETIAIENGYEPRVFEELGSEVIPHIDQLCESDMHFLTRLARDRNATFKPAGGTIVFTKRGLSTTARGEVRSPIVISKNDLKNWNNTLPGRAKYASVEASWYDLESGELVKVVAGEGSPVRRLSGRSASAREAQVRANAELDRLKHSEATISLSLSGDTRLMAETDIEIKSLEHNGGMRTPYAGIWSIKKAVHSFSDKGYTTRIDCEYPDGKS